MFWGPEEILYLGLTMLKKIIWVHLGTIYTIWNKMLQIKQKHLPCCRCKWASWLNRFSNNRGNNPAQDWKKIRLYILQRLYKWCCTFFPPITSKLNCASTPALLFWSISQMILHHAVGTSTNASCNNLTLWKKIMYKNLFLQSTEWVMTMKHYISCIHSVSEQFHH